MGKDLTTIVRDLPVDVRPRSGPARRLRPRDRHPALPRVRVPDAHRAAAGDDRGERRRRGAGAARGRDRRVCSRGARRRCGATVRLGFGADRSDRRPRAAGSSSRSISMRWGGRAHRGRGRRVGRIRRRRRGRRRAGARLDGREPEPRPARARTTCPRRSPPRSPTRRASRSTRRPDRGPRAVARRPARGRGSGSCSTTRVRAAARRWRSRSPAPTAGRSPSRGPTTLRRSAGSWIGWRSPSSATRSSRSWWPASGTTPRRTRRRSRDVICGHAQRCVELVGELAGAGLALAQHLEDARAQRVGERLDEARILDVVVRGQASCPSCSVPYIRARRRRSP